MFTMSSSSIQNNLVLLSGSNHEHTLTHRPVPRRTALFLLQHDCDGGLAWLTLFRNVCAFQRQQVTFTKLLQHFRKCVVQQIHAHCSIYKSTLSFYGYLLLYFLFCSGLYRLYLCTYVFFVIVSVCLCVREGRSWPQFPKIVHHLLLHNQRAFIKPRF